MGRRGARVGVSALLLAALLTLLAGILVPAAAYGCEGDVEGALRTTPAGDAVCGSATPSPSPSPSPSKEPSGSTPTPSPRSSSRPASPTATSPAPAPTFPTQVLGSVITNPAGGDDLAAQLQRLRDLESRLQGRLDGSPDEQLNAFVPRTGPGLAATPGEPDAGFFVRAITLLLTAGIGAMWLWRARVRRWMIGV